MLKCVVPHTMTPQSLQSLLHPLYNLSCILSTHLHVLLGPFSHSLIDSLVLSNHKARLSQAWTASSIAFIATCALFD